ncbi:GNAT family N-acetyltransferase [Vibrio sp. Of7-15]|uniref:GNAT family N-acetyltransferase n=1 Tax=Vibrio sp. Of7-15 TaxID=2724879 RepID=UPI001EF1FEA1|nr:GNAT family N-acetyltransferase [Vibrio sp. Of7-15]MCG7499183.1 GNAT family N-acetyltransferase [Vibrio sp. Of7-15]
MQQPTIETERLRLRPFTLEDAKQVQTLAGHTLIAEMTANIPHPYEDGMAEAWIETHQTLWFARQAVVFAIERKEDSVLIGTISLTEMTQTDGNLGYWLGVPYWGKGYCTEASQALVHFAFTTLNLPMLYARHLLHNPQSGAVMIKSGFQYISEVTAYTSGVERKVKHYECYRGELHY